MKIGSVEIEENKAFLAPLAGVTDRAFRTVCRELGAGLTYSEMVSAKALVMDNRKTGALLKKSACETPYAVQIFGHDPETMRQGAQIVLAQTDAQLIDINMGCPVPKVVKNGEGSALMKDPEQAARIVERVVGGVSVPVTVKMRLGWDESSRNAPEFARKMEQAGAAALTVHGRTKAQLFSGHADWAAIYEVKQAVHIPVIANGDIQSGADAAEILKISGADACMVGRGAYGNPWIFREIFETLSENRPCPKPDIKERFLVVRRQAALAIEDKGEHAAMLEVRKHLLWYLKGIPNIKEFKIRVSGVRTERELWDILEELEQKLS